MSLVATDPTQQTYARLSGFLLLWLIVTGVSGMLITSHVQGSGAFADVAQRVIASERLYRIGLMCALVETFSALVLAFSLYMTLRPVNEGLAQLGMYWRIGESIIGSVGVLLGFMKLRLYLSAQGSGAESLLLDLLRQAGTASYNISATSFSIGSLIFFYLFYRSRYIPRALSALGIFASIVVTVICMASLIFPEYSRPLGYGWAPMAVAEVVTGLWLMVRGVETETEKAGA